MTPPASPARLDHRPEIDGLRAVAIASVVIGHAFPAWLPGGFAGVDIFFVISGYLITAIIASELAAGRFSLWQFWQRRIRRIVPALAVMLWVTAIGAWAILTPEDFVQFSKSLAAAAMFGPNLLFARDVDYFATAAGYAPLIHTWTLGVEEQFYLVFPVLMLALFRWRRRAAVVVVAAITLASFVLALWLAPRWPLGAFYLLPTRMWELGLGALCALVPLPRQPRGPVAALGLALIAAGVLVIAPGTPAPGAWFLLPTLGAVLVIRHAHRGTLTGRVLAWPTLAGLGLVSFGTYLWHQPLLALGDYLWFGGLPIAARGALIVIAVALGAASYRWIEQPVRRRKVLKRAAPLVLSAAFALAVPAAVGAAGFAGWLLPASGPAAVRMDGLKPALAHVPVIIPARGELAFVLYGDSHAAQYYPALAERFGPGALVSQSNCLAAADLRNNPSDWTYSANCDALPGQLAGVLQDRGVRTVIWAQRWERTLYREGSGEAIGSTTDPRGAALLFAALRRAQAQMPKGTRVLLVGNSPTAWAAGERFSEGWLRCRAALNTDCPMGYPVTLAEGREVSARLKAFAAATPGFAYVDPADSLCGTAQCWFVQDGTLNYWDGSHMTLSAARRVTRSIDPALIPQASHVQATLP